MEKAETGQKGMLPGSCLGPVCAEELATGLGQKDKLSDFD